VYEKSNSVATVNLTIERVLSKRDAERCFVITDLGVPITAHHCDLIQLDC
jgi:hypothetical protein